MEASSIPRLLSLTEKTDWESRWPAIVRQAVNCRSQPRAGWVNRLRKEWKEYFTIEISSAGPRNYKYYGTSAKLIQTNKNVVNELASISNQEV